MNPVYSKLWLWVALVTIPLSSNAAEHTWLDPSFVANAFVQVALRDEYSPGEKSCVNGNNRCVFMWFIKWLIKPCTTSFWRCTCAT